MKVMKNRFLIMLMIVAVPALFYISCSKSSADQQQPVVTNPGGGGTTTTTCDTVDMKYAADVLPILQSRCYSCHAGANTGGSGGISLDNTTNNTIGGTTAAARNIISGNTTAVLTGSGVRINPTSAGNVIEGNYIGTDVSGTVALANNFGITIESGGNTVGGATPTPGTGAGNIIAGNSSGGIDIINVGYLTGTTTIVGNAIGIGSGGNYALAAARALLDGPLDTEAIVRKAMDIAADICIYTNRNVTIETLKA